MRSAHRVPFKAHITPEKNRFKEKNAIHETYNPIVVNIAVCKTITPFFVLKP